MCHAPELRWGSSSRLPREGGGSRARATRPPPAPPCGPPVAGWGSAWSQGPRESPILPCSMGGEGELALVMSPPPSVTSCRGLRDPRVGGHSGKVSSWPSLSRVGSGQQHPHGPVTAESAIAPVTSSVLGAPGAVPSMSPVRGVTCCPAAHVPVSVWEGWVPTRCRQR